MSVSAFSAAAVHAHLPGNTLSVLLFLPSVLTYLDLASLQIYSSPFWPYSCGSFFPKAFVLLLSNHPLSGAPGLPLRSVSLLLLSSTTDNWVTRLDRLEAVKDVAVNFRLVSDELGDKARTGEVGNGLKADAVWTPRGGVATSGMRSAVTPRRFTDADGEMVRLS